MKPIKTKEAAKFLRANGWSIVRQNGPHDIWESADGKQKLALPRHTDCAVGIVRQIAKLMDIPTNWK